MIDTIRFNISDGAFYHAVCEWRKDDLGGVIPARINSDALRTMIENGKVINFEEYKEKKIRELLDDLNHHGLQVVIKDFFQLQNQGSWCRDITCCIDEYGHRIFIELSLPKFFNGQNVDLLYNYRCGIIDFITYIYQFFRVSPPDEQKIRDIEVSRIDFCYYYKFQSQIHALDFIRSFKYWSQHKRKRVHYYDTSVMFVGASYTLKFYMKYDEFQKHDKKEIIKNIASLMDLKDDELKSDDIKKDLKEYTDMISYCDAFSTGMVRSEFTVRKKKLNYDGIYTIGNLFDLDLIVYYESLLQKMGVLKMGHTGKNDTFNKLKHDKKLIQYVALVQTFGKEKVSEIYERTVVYKYEKMLAQLNIQLNDFDLLKEVDLSVREDDKIRVYGTADSYETAVNFINGKLF